MSDKINKYVQFIQNEQKRLNYSTITSPKTLKEAVPAAVPLALGALTGAATSIPAYIAAKKVGAELDKAKKDIEIEMERRKKSQKQDTRVMGKHETEKLKAMLGYEKDNPRSYDYNYELAVKKAVESSKKPKEDTNDKED